MDYVIPASQRHNKFKELFEQFDSVQELNEFIKKEILYITEITIKKLREDRTFSSINLEKYFGAHYAPKYSSNSFIALPSSFLRSLITCPFSSNNILVEISDTKLRLWLDKITVIPNS